MREIETGEEVGRVSLFFSVLLHRGLMLRSSTREKVKMRIEKGSTNFAGYIPKDLLPATWRNVN